MKWRSKATGAVYSVFDHFSKGYPFQEHSLALFLESDDIDITRPRAVMGYSELIEAFEKVQEVIEGINDGWDTE